MSRPIHLNGIPIIWNDEADQQLLGPLFPQGLQQTQNSINTVVVGARNNSGYTSPFGNRSLFYVPQIVKIEPNTFVNTSIGDWQNINDIDLWVVHVGFSSENELDEYLSGIGTDENLKTISQAFELYARSAPRLVICAYVRNSKDTSQIVYRFSNEAFKYIKDIVAAYKESGLKDKLDTWTPKLLDIGKEYAGFDFTDTQIRASFLQAIPRNLEQVLENLYNKANQKKARDLYTANRNYLLSMCINAQDTMVQNAMDILLKTLLELDIDVLETYNQQNDISKEWVKNLTANDIYHMQRRLLALTKGVKKLESGTFQSADEIIELVNGNFVDRGATGEKTKFIITLPFKGLGYSARKVILELFLDGRTLDFGGWWRHNFRNNYVSAGDIIYNLIFTASKNDRYLLLMSLESDQRYTLLRQSDDEFIVNLLPLISDAILSQYPDEFSQMKAQSDAIAEGNFFSYSADSNKRQHGWLNTNSKKISLMNRGFDYKSPSPKIDEEISYETFTPADPKRERQKKDEEQKNYEQYTITYQTYLEENASYKEDFDPFELLILTAESDIDSSFITLKKDDIALVPACVVYALIKAKADAEMKFLTAVSLFVLLLPLSIGSLVAALQTARALSIVVGITDVAADVSIVAVSSPDFEKAHPELVKAANYLLFFYGLARITYSGVKVLSRLPNSNLVAALKVMRLKFQEFFVELKAVFRQSSRSESLFREIFKLVDKGVFSEYQFLRLAKKFEKETGIKMHLVDANNLAFKELYTKWKNNPVYATFHSYTFKVSRYGMVLEGPAVYFFRGGAIKLTAYTVQHELFHLKLWFKLVKELGQKGGQALYDKIPNWLHEADVIGEMLKANKRKPGKWSMEEIERDLRSLNKRIKEKQTSYHWGLHVKEIAGKKSFELKDFESWDLTNWLQKIK